MHRDTLLGPSGLTDESPFGPMALLAHDPSDKDEINEAESDEISGGGAQINHNESAGPEESGELSDKEADNVAGGALSLNHNESAGPNEGEELSDNDSEEVSGGGLVVGTLHS
jgi:hypothetical protein